jgi:hypothetical protein
MSAGRAVASKIPFDWDCWELPLLVEDIAGCFGRARFSSTGSRQVFRRAW